jgi:putative ABC transport system permease protein
MLTISSLNRKLLREVFKLRGQVLTIALVLASGITSFIGLRGTYVSLEQARDAYYDEQRFGHVFATLERAPDSVRRRIETLPGVALVDTRISEQVTLPLEGMARPAYARLLSLPAFGAGTLNTLSVRTGRLPQPGRDDEVAVLESFASAHGLRPGDRLPAVINGKLRRLSVVSVVLSPEYIYAIRPGAIVNDPQRYAVLWMTRTALAAAFSLEGAFNDVALRLQPEAAPAEVVARLDRVLVPYGGDGAIVRERQISNQMLTTELGQLAALGGMVPLVFMGVAAFLMNLVLSRLIALQRPEIATLKAVGYSNRELTRHYLGLVSVVLIPGGVLGIAGGWLLGGFVLRIYQGIFGFPELRFQPPLGLLLFALLISMLSAGLGALLAVRAATKLPAAEAMRPPAPARYRQSLLERLGLGALAGPSGLMVWREVQRRPVRTLLSSIGIAGAVALLILGRFGLDSLDAYLEGSLRREQCQDLTVVFAHPVSSRVIGQMARIPGVFSAEGLRSIPVRARHEHRARDSVLIGLPAAGTLRRLVARGGPVVAVPPGGVLLTKTLGEILGLKIGDRLDLELREGNRDSVHPVVVGFVDESIGLSVYAQSELLSTLARDEGVVSSVLLDLDPASEPALEARLRTSPSVIDVTDLRADVQRLRDMNSEVMGMWTLVSISLAASVILGVVYNNARIALSARSRDLASLRVLGFSRGEISKVLIGGLAIEVALAIPIGLWLGRVWGAWFMRGVDQEMFRWAVVVAPRTYAMAAFVTLLAATASALWVRRSLDHLDLIAVLKTRE